MRTIKFRAYHREEAKMCRVDLFDPNEGAFLIGVKPECDGLYGKMIVIAPHDGRFCYFDEFDIMQYTGLLDRNGTEIYEGDILRIYAAAPWDSDVPIYPVGEVVFGEPFPACFCFVSKGDHTCCLYDLCGMRFNGEVIGNIHETPELL